MIGGSGRRNKRKRERRNTKEHKGKTNSSRYVSPYEAVCDQLYYLIKKNIYYGIS